MDKMIDNPLSSIMKSMEKDREKKNLERIVGHVEKVDTLTVVKYGGTHYVYEKGTEYVL